MPTPRSEVRQWRKFCLWGKGAAGSDQGLKSTQDWGIPTTTKCEMDIQPSWQIPSWQSLGTLHMNGERSHGRPHEGADPQWGGLGGLDV